MTIQQLDQDRYRALKAIHEENGVDITTGVFEQNDLEFIHDEIYNAIDMDYENHERECNDPECDHEFWESEESTYLIGFEYNEKNGEYEPDPEAEYSAIWNSGGTIQVIASKWLITGGLCSPCYPGQVDANSETSDILAYSIPPGLIGYTDQEEVKRLKNRIFHNSQPYSIYDKWIVQEQTHAEEFYHIQDRILLDQLYENDLDRDNLDQVVYIVKQYTRPVEREEHTLEIVKGGEITQTSTFYWAFSHIDKFMSNDFCHWTTDPREENNANT